VSLPLQGHRGLIRLGSTLLGGFEPVHQPPGKRGAHEQASPVGAFLEQDGHAGQEGLGAGALAPDAGVQVQGAADGQQVAGAWAGQVDGEAVGADVDEELRDWIARRKASFPDFKV
jgi:hypothetical protein